MHIPATVSKSITGNAFEQTPEGTNFCAKLTAAAWFRQKAKLFLFCAERKTVAELCNEADDAS
jgi:hypothetical protein